ncbi:hypothetical protein QAD02_005052 [Eretmocerus hayati]|uniref:Uncharacterized protein n=1 Tax=Eretmocerus hayati TaxID=131215 RepID=A0ACC2NRF5_9HYME|nr:hypothetical protein QAD02_005052 [Eretmocerus hayati]
MLWNVAGAFLGPLMVEMKTWAPPDANFVFSSGICCSSCLGDEALLGVVLLVPIVGRHLTLAGMWQKSGKGGEGDVKELTHVFHKKNIPSGDIQVALGLVHIPRDSDSLQKMELIWIANVGPILRIDRVIDEKRGPIREQICE